MADIGYQDGLSGFVAWVRKTDPTVKYRPADKRPKSPSEWFWLEKFEDRLLRHLKDEHDAESPAEPSDPPPPPPPPPPPSTPKLAPQTYNKGSRGQDARYCTAGLSKDSTGAYVDSGGFCYDGNGLCLGGRSGNYVPGLKAADEMDGREPCDPYNGMPPWPAESYQV